MPPRPRQADIAKLAGVSQATVSVVLGGNRSNLRMAESTRSRVLAAAEELGYVPDPVATRLASRRNNILGVYTFTPTFPTDIADSYHPILTGVEEQAAALGQDLLLFTGAAGRAHDSRELRRTRIADGCLFFGSHVPVDAVAPLLAEGFPLVHIGRRDELEGGIPHVGADYVTASATVVEHLRSLGHTNIRYVREHDDAPSSTDRERGACLAQVTRTDGGDLTADTVRSWIAGGTTALVVEETDTCAAYLAVRRAIREAGLRVPDDLSLAVLGRPPDDESVTGFEVPRHEMGRAAVRLLVDLVTRATTPDSPQARRLLACAPVLGASTDRRKAP
ncbi:LacI family DNA-binding transcriptional regulator [Actinosynnema pretiosum subsp. pretiosum]|uniref:LacI family DNA-binding transcriptional regulator n=1 Tax=Actinosynnema pretiosum subsp. pretiosum TaxID=103721 RepID=A0AA45R4P4_9PSEU|nr:hypothetical protein APASM_3386 [Actinosynnema pretiosum subsp. pretiosum]QUF05132.1 LacI family DNA-binding transcriptional regulator [Actinosynnema pretiosum subsp. pretiosum]